MCQKKQETIMKVTEKELTFKVWVSTSVDHVKRKDLSYQLTTYDPVQFLDGAILVEGPIEIKVPINCDKTLEVEAVKALESKKEGLLKKFNKESLKIEEEIQSLMALPSLDETTEPQEFKGDTPFRSL